MCAFLCLRWSPLVTSLSEENSKIISWWGSEFQRMEKNQISAANTILIHMIHTYSYLTLWHEQTKLHQTTWASVSVASVLAYLFFAASWLEADAQHYSLGWRPSNTCTRRRKLCTERGRIWSEAARRLCMHLGGPIVNIDAEDLFLCKSCCAVGIFWTAAAEVSVQSQLPPSRRHFGIVGHKQTWIHAVGIMLSNRYLIYFAIFCHILSITKPNWTPTEACRSHTCQKLCRAMVPLAWIS